MLKINSNQSLNKALDEIKEAFDLKKYLEIEIKVGGKRGLSQNALSHVWYSEIDKALCQQVGEAKRYCKLHFGVPILRAEDSEFEQKYDKHIKHKYTYEDKLEVMDLLPVTSRMSKDQMKRYLTAIQVHFAQQGLVLEGKGEFIDG